MTGRNAGCSTNRLLGAAGRFAFQACSFSARTSVPVNASGPQRPSPARRILEGIPIVSSDLLPAIRRGKVLIKRAIDRLMAHGVRFVDGSEEAVDSIVCPGWQSSLTAQAHEYDGHQAAPSSTATTSLTKRRLAAFAAHGAFRLFPGAGASPVRSETTRLTERS
jgi:hypothetical protein